MIRRILLAAALLAATGRWAHAAACLPWGSGPLINGFETTGSACTVDFPQWAFASVPAANATWNVAAGAYPVIQGSNYGWAVSNATGVTKLNLTITAASSPALAANNDWTSPDYNYLAVAYYSTTTTADAFYFEYQFTSATAATAAQFTTAVKLQGTAPTSVWTYLVTSLNYARNLGYDTSDIQQITLNNYGPVGNTILGIAYDDLQLDPATGTVDTPNPPVPVAQTGGTSSGCAAGVDLTWSAQTQTGTDTIAGYHIYRSVTGPTGPWVSVKYVLGAGTTTYTDTAAGMSSDEYFIILPYSSTTTAFGGGAAGLFTGCNTPSLDPVWVAADGGVNEAALGAATPTGPFNAVSGCTPTDTPSDTPTSTDTPTFTPSETLTPTYTLTDTPSDTPTDTPTFTLTDTPSDTPTDTPTFTLTSTLTLTPTYTLTDTPSDTPTPTPSFTLTTTVSLTPTPTFSSTLTWTQTSTLTSTQTSTETASPLPTQTSTLSSTPTATFTWTQTSTATPTLTDTQTWTMTPTLTPSPSVTSTYTATMTFTVSPTPTISPTFTPSPVVTPITAQVWPNPVYPDRGQVLHLGNVPPGFKWTMFDMIGKFVFQSTTQGNPTVDVWNGYNQNGIEVTTGIYLLYLRGNVYRIAVVRN